MKSLLAENLIFLVTVVHSFPFPRPTGPDFPPFVPFPTGDHFFDTENRAQADESAFSQGEGIDDFQRFGIGCSGNSGFPEGPDSFVMSGGSHHREEHEGGGGPLFMMDDRFDTNSMSGAFANAKAAGEKGSHFLGGGIGGAFGNAAATANAVAGIDAGAESAQSMTQTKSESFSGGNGALSSASSFSTASAN